MTTIQYKKPANRHQRSILPESIEDYVDETNPVRAIDAYVESLDLSALNFRNTKKKTNRGQPAYDPASLLKLYLYGYIHKVRSSRCLERETRRNLEVLWLMGKLQPTYKTIADFRKNNATSLKAANKEFILLCKELELFGGEVVGIDGSFFNGDASKGSIYTKEKLDKQITELEKKIEAYQEELTKQDNDDDDAGKGSLVKDDDLAEKLKQLQKKQTEKRALAKQLADSGNTQISATDQDARLLRKRGQVTAGYNVQIAVDSQNKLITNVEATNEGNDSQQLSSMAIKAKAVLGVETLIALGDAGYYESEQIKSCEDAQITAYVAVPDGTKARKAQGRHTREDFEYDQQSNTYLCPAGKRLEQTGKPRKIKNKIHIFYASKNKDCKDCRYNAKCLTEKSDRRQISRWEHEEVLERHKKRMKETGGEWMRLRSALAEHPFGTLKRRAGWDHFLVRGLEKVGGELSLMTLCYNFTRVLSIIGIEQFRKYCEQRRANNALCDCF